VFLYSVPQYSPLHFLIHMTGEGRVRLTVPRPYDFCTPKGKIFFGVLRLNCESEQFKDGARRCESGSRNFSTEKYLCLAFEFNYIPKKLFTLVHHDGVVSVSVIFVFVTPTTSITSGSGETEVVNV
jgi:hypothetical protein